MANFVQSSEIVRTRERRAAGGEIVGERGRPGGGGIGSGNQVRRGKRPRRTHDSGPVGGDEATRKATSVVVVVVVVRSRQSRVPSVCKRTSSSVLSGVSRASVCKRKDFVRWFVRRYGSSFRLSVSVKRSASALPPVGVGKEQPRPRPKPHPQCDAVSAMWWVATWLLGEPWKPTPNPICRVSCWRCGSASRPCLLRWPSGKRVKLFVGR